MNISKKLTILFISLTVSTQLLAQHDGLEEEDFFDLQQFNITGNPLTLKLEDVVIPTNSLEKTELRRMGQASLGSTLDGLPGIHSTSYAAGAGRPVIRGFDEDRVSILQNGTDTFDVAFSSPDHGVTVEPLLIDGIVIVRGPSSLLYGNAAIGGVVNVIDKTLHQAPMDGVQGEAEFKYGSVSDETAGGLSVQGGRNDFAWSLGYHKRKASDYSIPGFAESRYLHESEEHEDHHEHEEEHEDEHEHEEEHEGEHEDEHEEEEIFGTLRDSFVETETLALGATWFGESATYSLSFNGYESQYGVPGHTHAHHHEHEHDEEEHGEEEHGEEDDHEEHGEHEDEEHGEGSVVIDLENRRTAFRAEWVDLDGFLESIELNATYGDYEHIEAEGEAVGTTYERNGYDLRLSGIHRNIGDWFGALGLDLKNDRFEAIGAEAFIPTNDKRNLAMFAVNRMDASWGAVEIGARLERQTLNPEITSLDDTKETTANLSTGLIWRLEDTGTLAVNVSLNQRAPNASELYAFGPHVGTGSFEVGDPSLGKEKSNNLNASWRKTAGFVTGEFTLFFSDFTDYIFLEHLDHEEFEALFPGEDDGGLEIVKAEAVDAEFYGYEIDLRFNLADSIDQSLHFDLTIDQTRATNQTERTNLPRIPTRRIGGRLEYENGPWHLGLGARYHSQAHHLAPEETPSDSYTLVFADINYNLEIGDNAVEFFVMGRNLSDEEARPHTSFVKDRVPLPGRSVEFGARIFF